MKKQEQEQIQIKKIIYKRNLRKGFRLSNANTKKMYDHILKVLTIEIDPYYFN